MLGGFLLCFVYTIVWEISYIKQFFYWYITFAWLSQNYKYFIDHQSLLENGCLDGMFVTTVFLLDTSASMTGTGLEQMKTAFKNIIYGNRNSLSNQT